MAGRYRERWFIKGGREIQVGSGMGYKGWQGVQGELVYKGWQGDTGRDGL